MSAENQTITDAVRARYNSIAADVLQGSSCCGGSTCCGEEICCGNSAKPSLPV